MAKCKFCGEVEKEKFYKSNNGSCKDCIKERVRQNRLENIEKVREYDRNRPNAKERNKKHLERIERLKTESPEKYEKYKNDKSLWAKKNRWKRNAQDRVAKALYNGKLTRPKKCERCEEVEKLHGHHPDYNKPLEVIWLCPACHGAEHKRLNQEKRNKF